MVDFSSFSEHMLLWYALTSYCRAGSCTPHNSVGD